MAPFLEPRREHRRRRVDGEHRRAADAVLAGHGDSARLKADLSKLQEDSALRRQRADELAARLRKRRLAEKAANETAEQRAQAAAALMSSVQIR